MPFIRPYTIFTRIAFPALLTVVLFAAAFFCIILPQIERSFFAYKHSMIKELTESAWSILETCHTQELVGTLSQQEAQQQAIIQIQALRYGPERKNYFWLNDMTPTMVMHPYQTDLNGQDVTLYQDPSGKRLFLEFVKIVEEQGAGYVRYMWKWKEDQEKVVEKVSYVKGFTPWGWIIGSGVYLEDVYAELTLLRHKFLLIAGVIFFLMLLMTAYIILQTKKADSVQRQIIAERLSLHEALVIQEEQYRALVESSSDWIWEVDQRGIYTYCSPKVEEQLGYPVEEVVGKSLAAFMIPGEKNHAGKSFKDILVAGEPFTGLESICRHKDGHSVVIEKNGVPFFSPDKKELFGFRGVARDISDKKRSEEALWLSHNQLHRNLEETVQSLAIAAEKRDPYTAGHQVRVEHLAHAMGVELGLSDDRLQGLHFAALLHDIGKISLPAEYLTKPTRLSKEERSIIKCHTEAGYEILKRIQFPWPVAEIVYQHHELLDGSGYPRGLTESEILLEAKIITVADVVEAMSSHRPYRPSLGLDAAMEEIHSGMGIKYDPQCVKICLYLLKERKFDIEAVTW